MSARSSAVGLERSYAAPARRRAKSIAHNLAPQKRHSHSHRAALARIRRAIAPQWHSAPRGRADSSGRRHEVKHLPGPACIRIAIHVAKHGRIGERNDERIQRFCESPAKRLEDRLFPGPTPVKGLDARGVTIETQ